MRCQGIYILVPHAPGREGGITLPPCPRAFPELWNGHLVSLFGSLSVGDTPGCRQAFPCQAAFILSGFPWNVQTSKSIKSAGKCCPSVDPKVT